MKISKIKIQRFLAMAFCVVVSVSMFSLPTVAQDDRGRDRRDRDSRDRERDIEREKWKQKFDLKGYLEKLDTNKSGVLESKELESERTRQFLAKLGVNAENPVRIDAAVKKAKATYTDKRDAERKKFEDQIGPKLQTFGTETETMGLTAFGATDAKEPKVATFDERMSGLKMTDFEEKTLKDARQMLDGYDRDKSGFLEGDEINRVRWKDPKPAESDLNSDGRISLLEMAQRLQDKSAARAKKSEQYDDRGGRDYDRKDRDSDRQTSRYGRTSENESSRASTNASLSSRSSKGPSRSTRGASDENPYANYIDGVYKKYDTDGDKRLSQAELKKMRRPLKGDADRDGFLSKEEATNYIKGDKTKKKVDLNAGKSNAAISNTGDRSGDGGRGTPSKSPSDAASRKRTSSSTKKSSGAKSRGSLDDMDANSDGQIQMAEYSKDWDEATLQKFRKTDTNQDGIISADEWSKRSK